MRHRRHTLAFVVAFSAVTTTGLAIAALTVSGLISGEFSPSISRIGIGATASAFALLRAAAHFVGREAESNGLTIGRADFDIETARLGLAVVGGGLAVISIIPDIGDLSQVGALQQSLLISAALALSTIGFVRRATEGGHVQRLIMALARLTMHDAPTRTTTRHDAAGQRWAAHPLLQVGVFLIIGLAFASLISEGALGHDESVYALKARSWIEGTPDSGFGLYRPIGLAAIAWGILSAGFDEIGLRAASVIFSVAAVFLISRLGQRLFSPFVGVITAILIAGSPSFLRRVPEFLNDIASTGLTIAIVLILWRHFEDGATHRWELLLAAPLASAAFYLRYGSVSTLLVIAVVGGTIWRRQIMASVGPLLATSGVVAALVLPHMLYSASTTGSVTGILANSASAAGKEYVGEGLLEYLRWLPDKLAGPILGWAMAIGALTVVVTAVRTLTRRGTDTRARAELFLGGVGLGHLALTGLFVHAEQRYVFISIMLLGLLGVSTIVRLTAILHPSVRRTLLSVGLVLLIPILWTNIQQADQKFESLASDRQILVDVSSLIQSTAPHDNCVVMTSYIPQITWYSKCSTVPFQIDRPLQHSSDIGGGTDFVLLFENGKRQPQSEAFAEYLEELESSKLEVEDFGTKIGDASLYLVLNR